MNTGWDTYSQIFEQINRGDELRVPFNIGSQLSVSREIVRIKRSVELSAERIKHSQLYSLAREYSQITF